MNGAECTVVQMVLIVSGITQWMWRVCVLMPCLAMGDVTPHPTPTPTACLLVGTPLVPAFVAQIWNSYGMFTAHCSCMGCYNTGRWEGLWSDAEVPLWLCMCGCLFSALQLSC